MQGSEEDKADREGIIDIMLVVIIYIVWHMPISCRAKSPPNMFVLSLREFL